MTLFSRLHPYKKLYSKKLPGFTLLEVSISLIIFGMIIGVSLPFFTSMIELERQRRTNSHKEQIFHILGTYFARHKYLPCPSLPSLNGKAHDNCLENSSKCIGILPYQTLGIPPEIAKDGHGHWFTYSPDPKFAVSPPAGKSIPSYNNFYDEEKKCRTIKLRDAQTNQEIENQHTIFVLISHGKEGNGAYTQDDSPIEPTNEPRILNWQPAHHFYVGQTPDYDHQVFYMPQDILLSYYAQIPNRSVNIGNDNGNSGGNDNNGGNTNRTTNGSNNPSSNTGVSISSPFSQNIPPAGLRGYIPPSINRDHYTGPSQHTHQPPRPSVPTTTNPQHPGGQ